MGRLTVLALRIVLAVILVGALFVQVVMVPLLAADLGESGPVLAGIRTPIVIITVLGIVTIQITVVCVWRLLTMVHQGTVFSAAAFRYVNTVIAAAAAASLLILGLAVTLAPGDAVPPGVVLLIGGVAVVGAGIALVVLVLRMVLAQAVAREIEAHHLRAELDEVI